jgi:hypothetical protein
MSRPAARADLRILRHTSRILAFLETEISFLRSLGLAAAAILLAWALVALGGAAFVNNYVLDFGFAVGEAWRLDQGQIPYLDWRTPLGPLYYVLVGSAAQVAPSLPEAVVWAGFLGALLFVAPTLLLLRIGMPGGAALALLLALWLMAAGPRNPDGLLGDVSWLALYNGLCIPLLAAVLVAALFPAARPLPKRTGAGLQGISNAAALGVCTAALLLTKAPHGALALAGIVAGIALRADRRHLLLSGAALGVAIVSALAALFPAAAAAHLAQLAETAQASDPLVRLLMKKELVFGVGAVLLGAGFVAIWLVEQYRKEDPALWPDVAAILAATALAWGAAFQDHPATPVLAVMPPLLAWRAAAAHRLPIGGAAGRLYRGAKATLLLLVPGVALAWWTLNGAASLPMAAAQALLTPAAWGNDAPHAAGWRLPADPEGMRSQAEMTPAEWQATLVAAAALVRAEGLEGRRILVLDFANPMPWLLQAPPPRGVLAWMDPDRTLPARGRMNLEALVGDAEVLLVPKRPSHPRVLPVVARLQGEALTETFRIRAETDLWRLRVRSQSVAD